MRVELQESGHNPVYSTVPDTPPIPSSFHYRSVIKIHLKARTALLYGKYATGQQAPESLTLNICFESG